LCAIAGVEVEWLVAAARLLEATLIKPPSIADHEFKIIIVID